MDIDGSNLFESSEADVYGVQYIFANYDDERLSDACFMLGIPSEMTRMVINDYKS